MTDEAEAVALAALEQHIEPEKAAFLPGFFKAVPGGYGEGDRFLGVRVPRVREVARQFRLWSLAECRVLLHSPWHEVRQLGLLILVSHYERAAKRQARGLTAAPDTAAVVALVLAEIDRVNNWDLTDLVGPKLIGPSLVGGDCQLLYDWAASDDLWLRRLSMVSTYAFIRAGDADHTLVLAEQLLDDPEDLIHKAVGWMLREVANRDLAPALAFVCRHQHRMPRTMLRYAIEKYPEPLRRQALAGTLQDTN